MFGIDFGNLLSPTCVLAYQNHLLNRRSRDRAACDCLWQEYSTLLVLRFSTCEDDVVSVFEWSILLWNRLPGQPAHDDSILLVCIGGGELDVV